MWKDTEGKSLHVEIETCKIVDVQMVAFHTNIVTLLLWKTRTFPSSLKQVTRGHNIVADGWAGASNPHPFSNPNPTLGGSISINFGNATRTYDQRVHNNQI